MLCSPLSSHTYHIPMEVIQWIYERYSLVSRHILRNAFHNIPKNYANFAQSNHIAIISQDWTRWRCFSRHVCEAWECMRRSSSVNLGAMICWELYPAMAVV